MQADARMLEVAPEAETGAASTCSSPSASGSRARRRGACSRAAWCASPGGAVAEAAKGVTLAARRDAWTWRRSRGPRRARCGRSPSCRCASPREGPGWLVVDKPAGMPVHPLARGRERHAPERRRRAPPGDAGRRRGRAAQRRRAPARRRHLGRAAARDGRGELAAAARGVPRAPRGRSVYRAIALGRLEEARARSSCRSLTARHRPARVRVARGGAERARGVRAAQPRLARARARSAARRSSRCGRAPASCTRSARSSRTSAIRSRATALRAGGGSDRRRAPHAARARDLARGDPRRSRGRAGFRAAARRAARVDLALAQQREAVRDRQHHAVDARSAATWSLKRADRDGRRRPAPRGPPRGRSTARCRRGSRRPGAGASGSPRSRPGSRALSASMKARSKAGSAGSARSVSAPGAMRSSMRSATPAFSQ